MIPKKPFKKGFGFSGVPYYAAASGLPPTNTVAPVISGNVQVGQTLSSTTGTWTGDATINFTYQWKNAGSNIASATASTYILAEADAGASITCAVTGTNGVGNATGTSNALVVDVYLIFLTHIEDPTDLAIYSGGVWNSVSLGVAATNRKIIVTPTARNSAGGTFSSGTVAGNSLTSQIVANSDTLNNKAYITIADVTTGTTGNIVITFSVGQQRCGAGVWAMYGAGSSTASDTKKAENIADGNVNLIVPAKGVAVGVSYHQTAGTNTWTGLTGRYTAAIESTVNHTGADLNSNAGGTINMISDWSAVDTTGAHAFASWGP